MPHDLTRLGKAIANLRARIGKARRGHPFVDRMGLRTFLRYLHDMVEECTDHGFTESTTKECVLQYFGFSRGQLEKLLSDVNSAYFRERPYIAYYGLRRIARQARDNETRRKKREGERASSATL